MMAQRRERPVIIGIVGDFGRRQVDIRRGPGRGHRPRAHARHLHRRLPPLRPSRARRQRPHPARPGLQLPRHPRAAHRPAARRPADPQADLQSRRRRAGAAGVRGAAALHHPRGAARLCDAAAARGLRPEVLSRAAGTAPPALEVPARHRARRLRLHRRAGDGAAAEAEPRQRALRRAAARLRRHGGELLRARREAGRERQRASTSATSCARPCLTSIWRRCSKQGADQRPGAGTGARHRRPARPMLCTSSAASTTRRAERLQDYLWRLLARPPVQRPALGAFRDAQNAEHHSHPLALSQLLLTHYLLNAALDAHAI